MDGSNEEPSITRRSILASSGVVIASPLSAIGASQEPTSGWRQYGYNQANTAANTVSDDITASPTRRWELEVNSPIQAGIAVVNGSVYTFGSNGDIYAVDESENVQVFAVGADADSPSGDSVPRSRAATPAVQDGALYIGGLDGSVYALDVDSQSELWSTTTGEVIRASPVLSSDSLYISETGGSVFALNIVNGDTRWSTDVEEGAVYATPALSESQLYVGTDTGIVTALDVETGDFIWTFSVGATVYASPTLDDSRVFVGTMDGTVYGLTQEEGERAWDATVPGSVIASPALEGGSLYVADDTGTVVAFETGSGSQRWRDNIDAPIVSDPVVSSDLLYLATRDGRIVALDISDGSQHWEFDLGSEIVGPLTLADGELYVGTTDGTLVSVREDTGIIATLFAYGEDAVQTVERNPLMSGGAAGTTVAAVGGYIGLRRYRSRSPETATDKPDSQTVKPPSSGDVAAIAEMPSNSRRLPDLSGASYDEFQVEELIGSGGSADVNRAVIDRDGQSHTVALKTPRMSDYETVETDFFEEFVTEAEIWENLDDHDGIVSVLGWGQQPYPWIALEYMEQGNLDELMGEIDRREGFAHLEQICNAVHHAHRHGVTHTDLKPENILYTTVEGTLVPKVTDWGLANVLIEHSTTVEGMTPAYAAPEQIEPNSYGGTDDRTDIYQLGVIAYELLTGRLPFEYDSYTATMNGILNEAPPSPTDLDASIDPVLSDVLLRALAKDKTQRYETALHFRDALRRAYHEGEV